MEDLKKELESLRRIIETLITTSEEQRYSKLVAVKCKLSEAIEIVAKVKELA